MLSTMTYREFRDRLAAHFAPDTAAAIVGGKPPLTPSAGHCAAVAVLVRDWFGGDFVSAIVNGQSHWFNRVTLLVPMDLDLTADQFGFEAVRFGEPGSLYPETRVRYGRELNENTKRRAALLAVRAGLKEIQ